MGLLDIRRAEAPGGNSQVDETKPGRTRLLGLTRYVVIREVEEILGGVEEESKPDETDPNKNPNEVN